MSWFFITFCEMSWNFQFCQFSRNATIFERSWKDLIDTYRQLQSFANFLNSSAFFLTKWRKKAFRGPHHPPSPPLWGSIGRMITAQVARPYVELAWHRLGRDWGGIVYLRGRRPTDCNFFLFYRTVRLSTVVTFPFSRAFFFHELFKSFCVFGVTVPVRVRPQGGLSTVVCNQQQNRRRCRLVGVGNQPVWFRPQSQLLLQLASKPMFF